MASAARHLDDRQLEPAAADQRAAIDELEKIWDAVIPFHPLLARDLADQTKIAQSLTPAPAAGSTSGAGGPVAEKEKDATPAKTESPPNGPSAEAPGHLAAPESPKRRILRPPHGNTGADTSPDATAQAQGRGRAGTTGKGARARCGRERASRALGQGCASKETPSVASVPKPVDPKQVKAGYQKAIDLAPRAATEMERATKSLNQKKSPAAYPPAEEARKILEEIQKAQPKQDQEDKKKQEEDKKKQDQQKQDQKKTERGSSKKKDQKDQQKKDQEKKDQQKDEEQKKDQQKKDQDQQQKERARKSESRRSQVSKTSPTSKKTAATTAGLPCDQIEDALRKVRERQQEKRERDRKMNARLLGRVPVEKDW